MTSINLRTTVPEARKQLKMLKKDVGDKAMRSTVNKVAAISKTAMSKEIRKTYKLRANQVRPKLNVNKAKKSSSSNTIVARLNPTDIKRSVNIIRFLTRASLSTNRKRRKDGRLKELRFKIKKSGGIKQLPGAFVANKGRTVFIRDERSTARSRRKYAGTKHGQSIRAVQTIGIPQMFNTKTVNKEVIRNAQARLPKIFANEVRFFAQRANRGT